MIARVSASSRAQTWIRRSGGKPRPASPGAQRSSRRSTQTASPVRHRGAAANAAKAEGATQVSVSSPSPTISCQRPRPRPPPGRQASISSIPKGSTPRSIRPPVSRAAIFAARAASRRARKSDMASGLLMFHLCSTTGTAGVKVPEKAPAAPREGKMATPPARSGDAAQGSSAAGRGSARLGQRVFRTPCLAMPAADFGGRRVTVVLEKNLRRSHWPSRPRCV